ncbi:hypothetical protein NDU88_009590 [Pleurodeles waltl]|uniref:Uncharacterized protein n=1 Tax=Pleurodeles waltl TaxID=8319 RepID=A0AAV7QTF5_PLEWA|nr:hypothetical protein NDU88_009590 [Pleurodeles waltl]
MTVKRSLMALPLSLPSLPLSATLAPPNAGRSAHERRNVWSAPRNPAGSPSGREREKDVRGPSARPGVAGPHPGFPARAEGGGRSGRTGRTAARRLLTPAAFARLGRRPAQAGKPRGEPSPPPPLRSACRSGGKTKVSDSPCPPQWGRGRRGSTRVPQGLCLAQGERGNSSEDGPTRILRAPAVDFGSGGPMSETAPTGGD